MMGFRCETGQEFWPPFNVEKTILSEKRVVAGLVPATPNVWLSAFTIEVAGTSPATTLRRSFYVIHL